ncbi:uncharacterized protein TNIN_415631 [Trichonephila inaurata madagascariensis]|uniref:Uncharacterized protein n=1 Tax=Trichonephila inaurata madagascariensis TaxID=2747483 RepID=A0A8X6XSG9_9ARAC|nr:uncharacterized protein TNIN_415631 [Trichonephila inaurata madagascariensis]
MNTCGDDILDLDLDSDVLIQLLGKLSLDNIPNDVSETLSSLENRTDEFIFNEGAGIQAYAQVSNEENIQNRTDIANEQSSCVQQNVISEPDEESKNSFLSSIGLVTDSCDSLFKNRNKKLASSVQDNVNERYRDSLLKSNKNENESFILPSECSTKAQDKSKKKFSSNTVSTNCNNSESSTSSSLSFFNVFRRGGQVFDIQLNSIESIKSNIQKLPFHSLDETSDDSNDKYYHSDPTLNQECDSNDSSCNSLLSAKQSFDSSSKSSNSQDSGYDTSSSTVSPSPPLINTQTFNSFEFLDDMHDDDLESIVAVIVEVENSITSLESAQCNVNVPVLKDAKNPEDHKKKIVNFLKEPILFHSVPSATEAVTAVSSDKSVGLSLEDEKLSSLSVRDSIKREISPISCHANKRMAPHTKRSPHKAKDKLGFELKYASKNDLGHLAAASKANHSERNKILKQIQDDERTKKKIKVIHLIDKKLKRTAADDRENQKRRRLLSTKEENQYKDSYRKFTLLWKFTRSINHLIYNIWNGNLVWPSIVVFNSFIYNMIMILCFVSSKFIHRVNNSFT